MTGTGNVLTLDERKVLILTARLFTNKEIAEYLGVPITKVKTLMHRASVKLGAHSRRAVTTLAIEQRNIRIDEIFPIEELAEYILALAPNALSKIAQFVCERCGRAIPPMMETDIQVDGRQENILTKRERDVLVLVGQGFTSSEMAQHLFLTTFSVKNALQTACFKLEERSRSKAFMSALKRGAILITDVITLDEIIWCLAQMKPESLEKVAELLREKLEQDHFNMAYPYGTRFSS